MREIGGYIELDTYKGEMLHDDALKLDCGRNCLAYLIESKSIKKIIMPYLMCDSVFNVCKKYCVEIRFYHVNRQFRPEIPSVEDDEWLYLMDYYGQMTQTEIDYIVRQHERVIVDYTHNYFADPVNGAETIYTCRKYFGVPDGAMLYTDAEPMILEHDISHGRMQHILGRYEEPASKFYAESVANNDLFNNNQPKFMSRLTENLLRAIDYDNVKHVRTENYAYLYDALERMNKLELRYVEGAFAYPLFVKNGRALREQLIKNQVFVPVLWPNVLKEMGQDSIEYQMVDNVLPLPCDQRYTIEDMAYIVSLVEEYQTKEK